MPINTDDNNEIQKLDNANTNSLMFVNNLASFSLSKEDLQKRKNILEKSYEIWWPERNLSKTICSNDDKHSVQYSVFSIQFLLTYRILNTEYFISKEMNV